MKDTTISILLIEDNLQDADLLREMLSEVEGQRYSVEHVQYLAQGLDLLRGRSFDVILLDLGLPESQGLETVVALRNQEKHTPAIVLTALEDEELALKTLEMDMQDYLIKSEITSSILKRSIRYAIQRKRISEELRETEQRFASFMLNLPATAWMKDIQGRYVYANAEAERIFSLPLTAMRGKTDDEIFPPETARQFRENDQRALAEGVTIQTTEVLRQADGIDHLSIVNKFPLAGPDGKPAYVAGVALDITERMRMEAELEQRTDQLEQAKLVAEAANRAKSEFLTNMSHEMRTPLTGISGVIDLLLTNGLTDQQRHFLNMAKTSADSLTQLINNVLDFSRIEAGKISLMMQPFDLRDCIRAAADIFAMEVDRKGLRFSLEIDDGVPEMVVGDAGRLRLVLVNLLANAVKFTEHGQIDVSVRPAPDPARPGQDVLLFTVRDTGIGISANYLENIFEKFTQAEELLSKKYGGAGLGLALVKKIVESMGGKIRVESRPGEGSAFFFTIPFVRLT